MDNLVKERMQKSVESFQAELSRVRTGRANLSILDDVRVDAYGTPTPLNQVATLSVPDARLITIQPWDRSLIPLIEKGIQMAQLGLTPVNDGHLIRVPIPPLTEERRKEFVKLIKKHAEEARVSIRNIRRDVNDQIKKSEKEASASEDEVKRHIDQVQKTTDEYISKIDSLLERKEKEIMTV